MKPNTEDPVVVVASARTPMGGFQGDLSPLSATELGSAAVRAAVARAGVAPEDVDQIVMGCVLPAGLGQAPARQAALGADLPRSVAATTVNKMCGSGMQAAILAHDMLVAGSADLVLAGGMESMTNAPYLLPANRGGQRLGHGVTKDHMFLDGLEDAYEPGRLMGSFAEETATTYGFSREDQDAFAIASLERARRAGSDGSFAEEIEALTFCVRGRERRIENDEQPAKADFAKIPKLRPAFSPEGTVTAANASSISDGAAALVLMRASEAKRRGLKAIAAIRAHAVHAQQPALFTTAPVVAIRKVLEAANWKTQEVDLFEVNEAFAVVAMAAMRDLQLPHDKVNVNGGACALGHPIGASGARIIVTLLHALAKRGAEKGVASLCIGGGEATALALQLLPH